MRFALDMNGVQAALLQGHGLEVRPAASAAPRPLGERGAVEYELA